MSLPPDTVPSDSAPSESSAPTDAPPTRLERLLPWLVGVAGTLVFLRPLLADPAAAVLDRVFWYDAHYSIDAIAALHRALETGPQGRSLHDWLYDDRFFFPQPRVLVISELVPWAALATYPLKGAPVLAYNVALAVACVLNVVAGSAFARAAGARPVPSLLGGVALAFGAYANFQSGRLQLLMLFPLAWGLAATLRFVREGRTRDAVLVGVNLFVAGGTCLYYAMFLALFAPPMALLGRASKSRPGLVRDLVPFAASLAGAALPLAWLLWPYRDMSAHLGLQHSLNDVRAQSGDLAFLFFADFQTAAGHVLKDLYRWDTAYWPGFAAMGGAVFVLARFAWTERALAARTLLPVVLGLSLSTLLTMNAALVGFAVALGVLVRRGRGGEGRVEPVGVALVALVAVTWFVWSGPYPSLFGKGAGATPYVWLVEHAPFFGGLRMVRRAGVVFVLVASALGALVLSRWEVRARWLAPLVLALTFAESVPLTLALRPIATACTDPALAAAREAGAKAVGEVRRWGFKHDQMTLARHQAGLCGVSTTLGPPGFKPPLAQLVEARLLDSSDPWVEASLQHLGLRHFVLEQGTPIARHFVAQPGEHAVTQVGRGTLVALAPTDVPLLPPLERGVAVPRVTAACRPAHNCARLLDGDRVERWTTEHRPVPADEVVLSFARTRVGGLRWFHDGYPLDVPPGFVVEARVGDGPWEPWARGVPDLRHLGREARRPVTTVALPPREVESIRLTARGVSPYWWSGTEVEVVAAE